MLNNMAQTAYEAEQRGEHRTMQESVKPGDTLHTRKGERVTVRVVSDNTDGAVFVCDADDGRVCVVLQREVLAHFVADCNREICAGTQRSLF